MSYSHTPNGFREKFLRNIKQRGGSGVFDPAERSSILNKKIVDNTSFDEFMDLNPTTKVHKIKTKQGTVFIYDINDDAVVKQLIENCITATEEGTLEQYIKTLITKEHNIIHKSIENDDDLKEHIFQRGRSSVSQDADDYIEYRDVANIVGGDAENKKKELFDLLREKHVPEQVDAYVATVLLDALELPVIPGTSKFPISAKYYQRILKPILEDREETQGIEWNRTLMTNLDRLAMASNSVNGHHEFVDHAEQKHNTFISPSRVHPANIPISLADNIKRYEDMIAQIGQNAFSLGEDENQIELIVNQPMWTNKLYPLLLGLGRPMIGGSRIFSEKKAQMYRNYFELKRAHMRGQGKDFSDNTWAKITDIINEIEAKENALDTYNETLKNVVFDSTGKVNDLETFKKVFENKRRTVIDLSKYYSRVGDLVIHLGKARLH